MRKRLLSAFIDKEQWSRAEKACIATVLLLLGCDNLLAQLGSLAQVRTTKSPCLMAF